MAKQKKKPKLFTQRDMEILLKAQKENRTISFEKGRPVITETPKEFQPRYTQKSDTPQIGGETVSVKPGFLLSPIEDVLLMIDSLELLAAHCSESLSEVERRREDCTHQLEPRKNGDGEYVDFATDETILAIGKRLQRIGVERRNIKNRFEVIKAAKRGFASRPGQEAQAFLRSIIAEVEGILSEQRSRTYTLRTDELKTLFDEPRAQFIELKAIVQHDEVGV